MSFASVIGLMIVSPDELPKEMCSTLPIFKSILSSVSAVILVSPSTSKMSSVPFKSFAKGALVVVLVLSLITYIEAPFAGAAENVILLWSPLPSTPKVNALPAPGSCRTLSIKTSSANWAALGTSDAMSNTVAEPSPVKLSFVGGLLNSVNGGCPKYAIFNYPLYIF